MLVTDQTDPGLAIGQIDLAQGTGRIDQTDPGLEIVLATDLLLEEETDLGAVTGPVPEQDQVHAQAQVQDRVQEQGQVHGQAQVQDQVQWIDQDQDQVRDKVVPEPVVEVPLVVTRTGALLPGTVNVVDPVVPANQEPDRQGVLQAGVGVEADQLAVVVDVAEAVVVAVAVVAAAAVDVDLRWP